MIIKITFEELLNKGTFDDYCIDVGLDPWCLSEGKVNKDDEIEITEQQAFKYGILK